MLPKKNRLTLSKRSFKKFDSRITADGFIIAYTKRPGNLKAAVSISKTVAKKAVDRNRIKRVLAEAIKDSDIKNLEFLLIVKENIAKLKTDEVKKRLEFVINKLT